MSARLARAAAIGVALALASLAGTWGLLFARPLPTIDGYYRMLGLHERGEVVRDVFGIPHVYASDAHDLFFLQGYVTAQDRLVEMERLRDLARAGAAPAGDVVVASAENAEAVAAYAEGVTKLVRQVAAAGSLPGELVLAGRRPADWTAADVVSIARAFLAGGPIAGSHCVVAPADRTIHGHPLLAADLSLAGPAPGWYEVGLSRGDARAVGISLPGVPGLVAGHNGWLAWSLARAAPDGGAALSGALALDARSADAFLERADAAAPCVADLFGDTRAPPGATAAGTRLDVDAMRRILGPPAAAVGARIVVDLSDVHTARSVVSHGASGQPASAHFGDQAPLWEVGLLHALQYARPPERRVDGDLVLRAR